jgi:uncharacterized protein involved in cysteine biosynthesis
MPDGVPAPAAPRSGRGILTALRRAIPLTASPRILAVVFAPLALSAVGFLVIGWFGFTPLTHWLESRVFLGQPGGAAALDWRGLAAGVIAFFAFMLAAVVTALVAIAVVAMPVIVRVVAERDFPALERRRGGTIAGSLMNATVTLALFVPGWLLSLLLLPLPPLFVLASLALAAWLNQRLLRYDALSEHASAEEMRTVTHDARMRLFGLGLVLAPLSYVPVVNLLVPLLSSVAFAYLCLDELAAARGRTAAR